MIPQKLQNYVVHWYHKYLLHAGMDRTEAMIHQPLFFRGISRAVQRCFNQCDSLHRNKKVKVTTKLVDETPWNKLCV